MSHYLDTEKGTVRKKWTGRLPVALIYPNTYPVAVSNLGFQLVYSLLNSRPDVVCERFVYPESDQSIRSLESNRPLTDFPVVFGSISFEDDFHRLVALLGAGGIEPRAAQRDPVARPGAPLVILGGVAVFMNPEPLASFADIMVIGEAEPVLPGLLQLVCGLAGTGGTREEIGRRVAALPGCYVPFLYHFTYDADGAVAAIEADPAAPDRVAKVVLEKVDRAAHSRLFSPEAELGMYMTELGRGCSRGCRFCAAGFIYRPPRLWGADQVLGGLAERPADMDRVGLLGMEMADVAVLDRISVYLEKHGCRLSFSSLRADRISAPLLSLLAKSKLKSAAIAPDGASERLRLVINKGLTRADLLAAADDLVRAGIVNLKLYIMIGLPTETEEDLEELVRLVLELRERIHAIGRERGRLCELTLSVNSFVPKPWTPFQYHGYGGLDPAVPFRGSDTGKAVLALRGKIKYLKKRLNKITNLRIKVDRPDRVLLQAVMARGDRRLGPVLMDMGLLGLSFARAMKKHGLTSWQYAVRPRRRDELFPWDVIDHGIGKEYLWQEYRRSMEEKTTKPCDTSRCRRCGVCHEADPV